MKTVEFKIKWRKKEYCTENPYPVFEYELEFKTDIGIMNLSALIFDLALEPIVLN